MCWKFNSISQNYKWLWQRWAANSLHASWARKYTDESATAQISGMVLVCIINTAKSYLNLTRLFWGNVPKISCLLAKNPWWFSWIINQRHCFNICCREGLEYPSTTLCRDARSCYHCQSPNTSDFLLGLRTVTVLVRVYGCILRVAVPYRCKLTTFLYGTGARL